MYAPSPPLQMSGITVHYSRFIEDGDGLSAADKIRIAVDSSPHGAISKRDYLSYAVKKYIYFQLLHQILQSSIWIALNIRSPHRALIVFH